MSTLGVMGIALFFLHSCKKDSVKSKTDLITASSWKLTARTVDPAINIGGKMVTDYYAEMDTWDKDDFLTYLKDGNAILDDGPTKENPSDPQTVTFSWAFNADETVINQHGEPYSIDQLDENTLMIHETIDGVELGGVKGVYKVTLTYKH